jgi:PKD repeat protein
MQKITTPRLALFLLILGFLSPFALKAQPAQFNPSTTAGCAPLAVTFYNSSIGNGSYVWNFGDPGSGPYDSSYDCSPTHTFVNAGSYTVTLSYVVNNITYTATQVITVYPKPFPSITGTDTLCEGQSALYTANGFVGSNYLWTATGGTITGSNSANPVNINWNTAGTGIIVVTETTVNGCKNTGKLNVLVANQPQIGNFCDLRRQPGSTDQNGKEGRSCLCQNNVSSIQAIDIQGFLMSNALYNFQWTVLSGGSIVSGANSNVVQVLAGAGPTVTVQLVAYNDFGCTDTQICVFDVCPSPTASAKADTACLSGATHFNASASSIAGQIVSYHWNFGDFSQITTVSPFTSHTYANFGTYNVTLTVKYASGCSDDTTFAVLVNNGTPPPILCPGTVCHHTKHCYGTPYYPGATYTWTVTGGVGTPSANGDSICVVWGAGPLGNITLNVTGGPYSCGYNSVDVPIFPANLQISGPDTACAGTVVQFSVPLIPGSCYSWLPSNPNISIATNVGNIINVNIPPGITGTYFVVADVFNDITCCKEKDTFFFVVQPSLKIDTAQSTCEFSTRTYTSNFPVSWSVNGEVSFTSTPTSITVNWGAAGTGSITACALNPNVVCNNCITVQIPLIALPPNPAINGPTMICVGKTASYFYIPHPNIAGSTWSAPGATIISSGNSAQITYATPGSYTITTTYFNSNNNFSGPFKCFNTATLNVLVVDTLCPVINGPDSSCIGSTVVYTLSSNPGNIWQWQPIGGNVLYQSSDSLIIQWGNISAGQINIQNSLCNGFCSKIVPIFAIPVGSITRADSTCKGDSIRLIGPPGYTWNWSTGATSQSIWATSAGLYSLTISKNGCATTLFQNLSPIPKKPKPNVSITANCMATPNLPVPYQMVATYNPQWSYSWTPQTSIPASADTTNTHFSTVFNSTHQVIVTNQFGCKDTAQITLSQSCVITGSGGGTSCSCNPTVSTSYDPCTGQFTATISGQPWSVVYWNFTDGDYSNQLNPQHWFSDTGYYNVQFAVYCASGCWSYFKVPVYVPYILRPKIKHTFPVNCNYNLISLSYKPNSVIKGQSVSYSTNWGDASTTTGPLTQNHTYANPGTYIIQHTVSVPGCSKTVNDTVTILPFRALFSVCDSGCLNQSVQFVDQSTSAIPIVNWFWTFGDGNNSNLQSPFHIYSSTGMKVVTLTIQNQQGCISTFVDTIWVTTFNPGALTFTKNGIPATGPTLTICDGEYVTATAPFNFGFQYAWSDGNTGNIDTITTSGVYWVNVTNGNGCIKKLGPFTVIVNPNPNATILTPDSMCSSSALNLLALSGLGYSYNWNLNNGAYVDSTNPVTFYSVPAGVVNTILTVTNYFGCAASDTLNLNWLQGPVVTVSPSYTAVCQGIPVTLTASVAGPFSSLSWNTGAITPSITVINTGSYNATAIDLNGCPGIGYGYVQVNPLPDLSNIPKGCYRLCKSASGVKVCGPIALPGQTFSYNWLQNGNPFSTNQNVVINANGTYQLIVTNTGTGCSDTSEIFSITFTAPPVANIGSGSPNPTICAGSNGCITLTVNQPQDGFLYTWYQNGEPIEVDELTITICDTGMFVLEAFLSNCCKAYDTIYIKEGDCCFNTSDTDFHLIQDSTVYTSNTWWDGKYYVAGRVYVRNKAALDMTTIDVVFDRDGEIIFEDSSIVRANNSVFRPCDMHDVWVGFTFRDSSSGFIHTSTFKNAKHAIDVATSGPEGVKITDNTFTDCHQGVNINRGSLTYNQGITSNSFVISDYNFTSAGLYPNFDYFGIRLIAVKMNEIVSQNNFRNSDRSGQNNRYYGIYMLRSLANISENKFTNMHRSIDVNTNTGLVNIENNEIEKTFQGKFSSDVQIRATSSDLPILIYANELRNSDNRYAKTVGIFSENTQSLNVRDNNIKGFDVGIWTRRTNNAVINENDIDMGGDIGILDSLSTNIDINCNVIRMKDCRKAVGTNCNSIGIYMQQGNNTNDIFTNCVFDTRRAIMVQRFGAIVPVPNIINNYLYNYQFAGIACINHIGTIGGGAQPGRNTFTSNNNAGGAFDITAIGGPISYWCNFGMLGTSGLVAPSGGCPATQMYSSTAACGHQIVNTKYYKLDKWDVCDNYTGKSIVIIILPDGELGIDKDKLKGITAASLSPQERIEVALILIQQGDQATFEQWMQKVAIENALDAYIIAKLRAEWTYTNQGKAAGIAALKAVLASNTAEQADKDVLLALWEQELKKSVTQSTLVQMAVIDQAGHADAEIARDILHVQIGNHDYKFGRYYIEPETPQQGDVFSPYLRLVPNPATESVRVEFRITGSGEAKAEMYDLTGNLLDMQGIALGAGAYQFDLRNLSPGIYLVSLLDVETQERQVTKLIVE